MPVHKVKGGFKWGKHGTVYATKAGAERQARAIYANGYREGPQQDRQDAEPTYVDYYTGKPMERDP